MTSITRRLVIATGALGTLGSSFGSLPVCAAEFSYKFASNIPMTHPLNVRVKEAVDGIRTESNGRFDIEMFPNAQLGSDTDMLSQLRSGALEFYTISPLILSVLIPTVSISALGFAFPDDAAVWQAMDGDLGAYVRAQIEKAGIVPIGGIWDNGFRQATTSKKPIIDPADFRGMKFRVPISPLLTSCFKALGASPTAMSFNELYTSLQTGLIDGEENPFVTIWTAKLYEVQKYCSLTNHVWDGLWFLANKASWERLPADLRELATRQIAAAAKAERGDIAAGNTHLQADLTAKGMIFNKTDPARFRQTLREAGFYSDWKTKFGEEAWATLERSVGRLS